MGRGSPVVGADDFLSRHLSSHSGPNAVTTVELGRRTWSRLGQYVTNAWFGRRIPACRPTARR